jgi:hypothetical protein
MRQRVILGGQAHSAQHSAYQLLVARHLRRCQCGATLLHCVLPLQSVLQRSEPSAAPPAGNGHVLPPGCGPVRASRSLRAHLSIISVTSWYARSISPSILMQLARYCHYSPISAFGHAGNTSGLSAASALNIASNSTSGQMTTCSTTGWVAEGTVCLVPKPWQYHPMVLYYSLQ